MKDLRNGKSHLPVGRRTDRNNGHKLPLSRAKTASSPTALSGPSKAWPVRGANLLTSQAAALAGCSRKPGVPTAGVSGCEKDRNNSLFCQQQAPGLFTSCLCPISNFS